MSKGGGGGRSGRSGGGGGGAVAAAPARTAVSVEDVSTPNFKVRNGNATYSGTVGGKDVTIERIIQNTREGQKTFYKTYVNGVDTGRIARTMDAAKQRIVDNLNA